MNPEIVIRCETEAGVDAIRDVAVSAFATLEISGHTEQFIIAALAGVPAAGHPVYYRKFGFENVPGLVHEGAPQEVFFALSFDGHIPQGTVTFHAAFKAGLEEPPGEQAA